MESKYASSALGVLVIGFAGSGKSTLVGSISAHFRAKAQSEAMVCKEAPTNDHPSLSVSTTTDQQSVRDDSKKEESETTTTENKHESSSTRTCGSLPYVINLDPAVLEYPYAAQIDIKDTISHSGIMEQYGLGPNGAIVTALNLYTTRLADVISLVERRLEKKEISIVLLDTPGQIECFTWSASGQNIAESVGSTMPTCILFVVDSSRCVSSPRTFMSNMLQENQEFHLIKGKEKM